MNSIHLSIVKTTSPIVPPVFTASSSFTFVIVLNMWPQRRKLTYCAFKEIELIKDEIWENRRCPWNIWHAKYLQLSAIHNPAVWMSSDWKIHLRWPTANERAIYRAAGSSGGLFFFLYKASIRIYRTGRLHEDEEGARVFPVNNILL